ncbi:MAG: ATP-binding cassette domain-containing protein [Spirochaetia bacterium]|nr:ATP-binding cassette domain-containing protein [Spirochaetia bacterium]
MTEDKNTIVNADSISLTLENKLILNDISFRLNKRETLVVMGKNGCGKTILLKTLAGIFRPQKGGVKIFDQNIHQIKDERLANLRKDIGYVFQKSGLFDSLTIAENVIFALRRFYKKDANELFEIAVNSLNRSGLKDVEDKLPSELSGGMQKRAGIARAIAMEPKLLLMDDPTAGLDPVLTDAIADLILEIKENLHSAFIIVTHDFNLAYKLADKIALMVNGEFKAISTVEDFKNSSDSFIQQFREGNLNGPIPVIE